MKKVIFPLVLGLALAIVAILLLNYYPTHYAILLNDSAETCKPSKDDSLKNFIDCDTSSKGVLNYYGWPFNFRNAPNDPSLWNKKDILQYQKFYPGGLTFDFLIILVIILILSFSFIELISIIRKKKYAKSKKDDRKRFFIFKK